MKNQKRMLAVIAASGLALGSLPGVANAQTGSLGLGLDLAVNLGSADVGVDLGVALGSVEPEALPTIPTPGEGTFGSLGDITGSAGDGDPAPAPTPGTSSLGSLIPDSEPTPGGSSGSGDEEPAPGSSSGSDEPDSASAEAKGSLQDVLGSLGLPQNRDELQGSLEGLGGSSGEGSNGESETPGSSGLGSSDNEIILGGGSDDLVESSQALGTGSGVGAVAALGSLALPAVAIGIAVSGNAGLPPLPEVNVGAVCNLPPEAIDFLKGNGSMEPEECLPPEEQPAP